MSQNILLLAAIDGMLPHHIFDLVRVLQSTLQLPRTRLQF